MKNEPCIIFGLNLEHKSTKHIFRAGSLCQMDTFPLNHLTNRQKKSKAFLQGRNAEYSSFKSCGTGRISVAKETCLIWSVELRTENLSQQCHFSGVCHLIHPHVPLYLAPTQFPVPLVSSYHL